MADFLTAIGTSIVRGYALVKLRSAYAGACLRIRRSSDNAEQDIGFDSDNVFDWAAAASFIGGGSGFVVTWYDQSTNADHAVQATTANQPGLDLTNDRVTFDGSNDRLVSSSGLGITGNAAVTTFHIGTSGTDFREYFAFGSTSGGNEFAVERTGTTQIAFSPNASAGSRQHFTPTSLAVRSLITVRKAPGAIDANTTMFQDGGSISQTGTPLATTPNFADGPIKIGCDTNNGRFLNGSLEAVIVVASALGTTERAAGEDWLMNEGWLPTPPIIENKWSQGNFIPRAGMIAWHMHSGGAIGHYIGDHSGNDRHLSGNAGNAPVIQTNLLNGQPGWYFNGSRDPLKWLGSAPPVKHLFVVASFEKSAFTEYEGLYGSLSNSGGLAEPLVSDTSGDEFFDFFSGAETVYRKNDVIHPMATAKAPMSGSHSILEISHPVGFTLTDGIQIGQQAALTARKFNGWFFEAIAYGSVLPLLGRIMIYEYLAMKFHLWPQNADGLYVYPFMANKTIGSEIDQETYLSEPYEGDPKALVRGGYRGAYQFPFTLRREEEFLAARAFRQQHGRLTHWIYRDRRYATPKDSELQFTSGIREQGSDVTFRFNYSFEALEV